MPKRSAGKSRLSTKHVKLGLGLVGIVLLFVLPVVGIIILAAVLFHHFFLGKK